MPSEKQYHSKADYDEIGKEDLKYTGDRAVKLLHEAAKAIDDARLIVGGAEALEKQLSSIDGDIAALTYDVKQACGIYLE